MSRGGRRRDTSLGKDLATEDGGHCIIHSCLIRDISQHLREWTLLSQSNMNKTLHQALLDDLTLSSLKIDHAGTTKKAAPRRILSPPKT